MSISVVRPQQYLSPSPVDDASSIGGWAQVSVRYGWPALALIDVGPCTDAALFAGRWTTTSATSTVQTIVTL